MRGRAGTERLGPVPVRGAFSCLESTLGTAHSELSLPCCDSWPISSGSPHDSHMPIL